MPKCKICGQPVRAAPVMHPACWESKAEDVISEFCDDFCHGPVVSEDEGVLEENYCSRCPVTRLPELGGVSDG